MPNTLEKQLKAEILKRKQQQRRPNQRKTLLVLSVLGTLSLLFSLARLQMERSAQPNQLAPGSEQPNSNDYEAESI